MKSDVKKLSIVIPLFNEEKLIPEIINRFQGLAGTLKSRFQLAPSELEIVVVNDGSTDRTFDLLLESCQEEPFRLVNLSRNYGHQFAITAGLDQTLGEAVVIIDGDLQDPPEFIVNLYEKYLEGYDVVYAVRRRRKGETWFKLATASLFYRLLRRMSQINVPVNTGDYRIMSRRVVAALSSMRESHRYIRGLTSWIGYRQTGIEYDRAERSQGKTKFTLFRMVRFALDAVTSFSGIPLRVTSLLGILTAIAGFLTAAFVVYLKLFTHSTIQGWSSLIGIILFIGGVQLVALGMIGEYVYRITEQVKSRPLYIIEGIYQHGKKCN